MGALGQALGSREHGATRQRLVAIYSAKSCYGHTEGAAGLTGAVLLMHLNEKIWYGESTLERLLVHLPASNISYSTLHAVACQQDGH